MFDVLGGIKNCCASCDTWQCVCHHPSQAEKQKANPPVGYHLQAIICLTENCWANCVSWRGWRDCVCHPSKPQPDNQPAQLGPSSGVMRSCIVKTTKRVRCHMESFSGCDGTQRWAIRDRDMLCRGVTWREEESVCQHPAQTQSGAAKLAYDYTFPPICVLFLDFFLVLLLLLMPVTSTIQNTL